MSNFLRALENLSTHIFGQSTQNIELELIEMYYINDLSNKDLENFYGIWYLKI